MEVRKAGHDSTAVPATADHQDANRPFQQLRIESVRHRLPCLQFLQVLV